MQQESKKIAVALGNKGASDQNACRGLTSRPGGQAMRTSTVIILAVAISMGGSAAYLTRTGLKIKRASAPFSRPVRLWSQPSRSHMAPP